MPPASPSESPYFQYGDIIKGLPFASNQFDFVYQRDMLLALPSDDDGWPHACREHYRVIRPEGYVELVETDHILRSIGPAGAKLNEWLQRVAKRHSIQLEAAQRLKSFMQQAGFEDIQEQIHPCPHGEWGGRIGLSSKAVYRQFILGLTDKFATIGVRREDLAHALDSLDSETEQTKGFMNIYICWGRKPDTTNPTPVKKTSHSAPCTPAHDQFAFPSTLYAKPLPEIPQSEEHLTSSTLDMASELPDLNEFN
jgi:hypothetical protein